MLETASDFPFAALDRLIAQCVAWKVSQVTFLGGEPTLYPRMISALELVHQAGMRSRIVTNGGVSFKQFLNSYGGSVKPVIGVSVDGSTPAVHDRIRQAGSLQRLTENVSLCRAKGHRVFGITSISRENVFDAPSILAFCQQLGCDYVNVHYVTNRGFAKEDTVLSIDEWLRACDAIRSAAEQMSVEVRLEETFLRRSEFSGSCAVIDRSNLMFMPDGRVFMCSMFVDVLGAHSFVWTEDGLQRNRSGRTEIECCGSDQAMNCAAMAEVNPVRFGEAQERGFVIGCIYQKTRLSRLV
jgi:MoaA/NifB/PqqE/SkfB family radical SAM enzyme